MAGHVLKVMLSSTYRDLLRHRAAVRDAIIGQGMLLLIMETDSANLSRGIITNSLAKVDEADAYVMLETDRPEITVRRRSTGWEAATIAGLDAELPLPEIEITIPLAAIYAR
jgi:hypothetical protein